MDNNEKKNSAFLGKVCPYCKTEFTEDDEIVVCSICEMPHHKDCWIENKACTTFGCTGTIVGADQYEDAVLNGRFCSKCGAPMTESQKFCSKCGAPVGASGGPAFRVAGAPQPQYQAPQPQYQPPQPQYQQPQQNTYNNAGYGQYSQYQSADPDMVSFIDYKSADYIRKFNSLGNNRTVLWNWCSFLFGAFWFAYRKMYAIAGVLCGIQLVLSLIPGIGVFLSSGLSVCCGLFGDYLYKQYAESEVNVAKSIDPMQKTAYLKRKGGTSVGLMFAFIGAHILITAIFHS